MDALSTISAPGESFVRASSPYTTLPSLHRSSILVWFPFTAAQNLETAPASLPDDDIISSSPREIHTQTATTHAGESARNFPRYLDHRHLTPPAYDFTLDGPEHVTSRERCHTLGY